MPRVHSLSEAYHTRTTGVLERSTEKNSEDEESYKNYHKLKTFANATEK